MKNNKITTFVMLLISIILVSCEEEDIMSYKGGSAVNFIEDAQTYSFLGNPEDVQTIEIPVRIMGNAVDYDRTFNVEVLEETNVPGNGYEIVGGSVEAGEFLGNLVVQVYNSETLLDSEASILLELAESAEFGKGIVDARQYRLTWTDQVVVPAWTYYRFFFTAVPSPAAYRAIVESTGITSFTVQQYLAVGAVGAQALGTKFGNYVKQWNLDNPDNPLIHDGGPQEGEPIVPLYYSSSLYD